MIHLPGDLLTLAGIEERPPEAALPFVRDWVRRLREAGANRLPECGLLVVTMRRSWPSRREKEWLPAGEALRSLLLSMGKPGAGYGLLVREVILDSLEEPSVSLEVIP